MLSKGNLASHTGISRQRLYAVQWRTSLTICPCNGAMYSSSNQKTQSNEHDTRKPYTAPLDSLISVLVFIIHTVSSSILTLTALSSYPLTFPLVTPSSKSFIHCWPQLVNCTFCYSQ